MKRFGILIMFFSLLIGSDSMSFTIPAIELNKRTNLQTIVDQEDGIDLGHPSAVLIVFPKGHGKGEIIYKRREIWIGTYEDIVSLLTRKRLITQQEILDEMRAIRVMDEREKN